MASISPRLGRIRCNWPLPSKSRRSGRRAKARSDYIKSICHLAASLHLHSVITASSSLSAAAAAAKAALVSVKPRHCRHSFACYHKSSSKYRHKQFNQCIRCSVLLQTIGPTVFRVAKFSQRRLAVAD